MNTLLNFFLPISIFYISNINCQPKNINDIPNTSHTIKNLLENSLLSQKINNIDKIKKSYTKHNDTYINASNALKTYKNNESEFINYLHDYEYCNKSNLIDREQKYLINEKQRQKQRKKQVTLIEEFKMYILESLQDLKQDIISVTKLVNITKPNFQDLMDTVIIYNHSITDTLNNIKKLDPSYLIDNNNKTNIIKNHKVLSQLCILKEQNFISHIKHVILYNQDFITNYISVNNKISVQLEKIINAYSDLVIEKDDRLCINNINNIANINDIFTLYKKLLSDISLLWESVIEYNTTTLCNENVINFISTIEVVDALLLKGVSVKKIPLNITSNCYNIFNISNYYIHKDCKFNNQLVYKNSRCIIDLSYKTLIYHKIELCNCEDCHKNYKVYDDFNYQLNKFPNKLLKILPKNLLKIMPKKLSDLIPDNKLNFFSQTSLINLYCSCMQIYHNHYKYNDETYKFISTSFFIFKIHKQAEYTWTISNAIHNIIDTQLNNSILDIMPNNQKYITQHKFLKK